MKLPHPMLQHGKIGYAAMEPNTFFVAMNAGHWRIGYDDQWYGAYGSVVAAAVSAVRLARVAPGAKVVVRKENESEAVIWNKS